LFADDFMAKRKIVLFGGTFDPIHPGHTAVASIAGEYTGAEKIIFIPAKRSPLKHFLPKAGDDDRLNMIALAIKGNENFELSDCELKQPELSYTLETVKKFQARYGRETILYWLVGADSINDLQYWYRITELIDQCNLSVMYRAGFDTPDFGRFEGIWGAQRIKKLQQNIIPTPLIDISSTEIRRRLAAGLDITDMLEPSVADYIREHGLYQ
jgi:nicotinate-nucleotide adenylyltransferase